MEEQRLVFSGWLVTDDTSRDFNRAFKDECHDLDEDHDFDVFHTFCAGHEL
jgi:hypothetical protein